MAKEDNRFSADDLLKDLTQDEAQAEASPQHETAQSPQQMSQNERRPERSEKSKRSFYLPNHLINALQDISYWDRESLNSIVETAIREEINRREEERGEPYPPREQELSPGRSV